jgi:protein TonB
VPPPSGPEAPPPLPKPQNIVETLTDDLLDDIELATTDLDVNADVAEVEPIAAVDEVEPDYVFIVVEQMPEPIGGVRAIQKNITYPEFAKRAGIQGRVYVKAFVNEIGYVFKVELVKGIGGGCDEVAMQAVKSALFSPGKQRGKPVKVQVTVPIFFKLQ